MIRSEIVLLLDEAVSSYNNSSFINDDPVSIPHEYQRKQDIEITALWTAILSWGNRTTILKKARELFNLMDNAPYDFISGHSDTDLERFKDFKHRTFLLDDTLCMVSFLRWYYSQFDSLEAAFVSDEKSDRVKHGLRKFNKLFISAPGFLNRTKKHVADPFKNSTCKRLNMFLRWMVRKDESGVDFGIWQELQPSDLMIPLDVHVNKSARKLGLLRRKQTDWRAVEELTENLRQFDPEDPVKYDYALFSLGVKNIDPIQNLSI